MDTTENKELIVQFLSENIHDLYDKDKNRIWKIIEHQLKVKLCRIFVYFIQFSSY